jgi:gluconate kinase
MVTRRANKAPPDQGGWNIFCTDWSGFDMLNPAVEQVLRCGGVQTAYRDDLRDVVKNLSVFWNVRRAS